jgi:ribosome biogenesis GTPase
VGKTSLLNALLPDLQLRTAAVSGKLQRGRHTTRHVELFPLAPNALLADTPGFNRPELPPNPGEFASLFPEIRQQLRAGRCCRFNDCRHLQEPGCGLERSWERYGLYQSLMQDQL